MKYQFILQCEKQISEIKIEKEKIKKKMAVLQSKWNRHKKKKKIHKAKKKEVKKHWKWNKKKKNCFFVLAVEKC